MIRINLLPSSKKRIAAAKAAAGPGNSGPIWVLGWFIGWLGLMGFGYWLVTLKEAETTELRRQAAEATKEAETIKDEIDEAGQEAKKRELDQLEAAITKLEKKKRTPVYVLYDLATILTDPSMDPSDPPQLDIDEVKLRQLLKEDPKAGINLRWDPSGLWIEELKEQSGVLTLEGSARHASDLAEFVRRLRASGRYGTVTSPDWDRQARGNDESEQPSIDWTIGAVAVRRWD